MRKVFFGNLLLLILINLLVKPVYLFGIDAQVQNQVGPEAYGVYFALFNFIFLFQILLDPGIQNYNLKSLSQDRDKIKETLPHTLGLKLLLATLFYCIVLTTAYFLYPKTFLKNLMLLMLVQIMSSIYLYLRSHFSALGKYTTDALLSGLDKFLMIILIAYYIVIQEISITLFIKLQLLAYIISIVTVVFLLKNHVLVFPKFSFSKGRSILKNALPYGLVFLLMTLYTRMDGVMLERLLDDNGYQAGVYAAAYRLLDAVNMFGYLFASLLLPMFARLISENKSLESLALFSLRLILVMITLVLLICSFYGNEILSLIYVAVTPQYVQTFKILIFSFFAIGISYIYGTMITASGRLKIFNLIFVIGIIFNWSLNLYLIPKQGAIGASMATLVTQLIVMCGQLMLAHRIFELKINFKLLLHFLFFLGSAYLLVFAITSYSPLSWIINLILSSILIISCSILMRFVRFKWIFGTAFE